MAKYAPGTQVDIWDSWINKSLIQRSLYLTELYTVNYIYSNYR